MSELLPVRMLNEYSYCPRLFALEWANGEWADSHDTVAGNTVHRRVDVPSEPSLPTSETRPNTAEVIARRSVYLGDPGLRLVAKIDLVEAEGLDVTPVDYKKGRPNREGGAWEPERVQICAQALLLRAHGYRCERGYLYYAASHQRVEVVIDEALVARTLMLRDAAFAAAESGVLPEPLVDSPKCPRCSLVGICLPDEQNVINGKQRTARPLVPGRDDRSPVYVTTPGAQVGKSADELVIKLNGEEQGRVGLPHVSRLVLLGAVGVSTPLLRELAEREIPVSFLGSGGWFYGTFTPAWGHNVMTRMAQHRVAADPERAIVVARRFVVAKIRNCRVLLRRNGREVPESALSGLKAAAEEAEHAGDVATLMGVEGAAARLYFQYFTSMIKEDFRDTFDFEARSRRPPKDPINTLLSFAYACLTREVSTTLASIGLDPYVGFLHQPRYGRPALALDLMEELRPVLADSAVITAVNNGVVGRDDFVIRTTGVSLTDAGRKRFIGVWEGRLDELATHPALDMRLSYRRIIEVQARLLGKALLGEIAVYPALAVR